MDSPIRKINFPREQLRCMVSSVVSLLKSDPGVVLKGGKETLKVFVFISRGL